MEFENLESYKRIHFVGIGGISMSAIAETLKRWGYIITGSDISESAITNSLISHGIPVTIGHDLINSKKADLIVYNAAIKDTDPELVLAKQNNIKAVDRGTFLGYLTKQYKNSICISGTHGKTTTTSLVSLCFINADKDPSIEVGALVNDIGGNYRIGNGEFFILESCEYKGNFLKFFPHSEIILNIDNDHLDYYKSFENVVAAFGKFASLLPTDGVLVTNADDKNCINLKNYTKANFVTYGIDNQDANFIAKNISFDKNGFASFEVNKNNELYDSFKLSIAGKHNVSNALACIALCDFYGISKDVIKKSLLQFTGAERRLEYKGSIKNNTISIFDDYAHHPTEIKATFNALKNKEFNESWVIFQPHTFSRTKKLLNDFAESLKDFDHIILVDIYAARENDDYDVSSNDLVNLINEKNKKATYISSFDDVAKFIESHTQKNDLILTLGAGTVTKIGPMIINLDKNNN